MKKTLQYLAVFSIFFQIFCEYSTSLDARARLIGVRRALPGVSSMGHSPPQNPAALAGVDSSVAGAYYSPSKFGIDELSASALFVGRRSFENIVFGGSFFHFGGSLYSESAFALGAAYDSDEIRVGFAAEYSNQSIKNYEGGDMFQLNIGAEIPLANDFSAGFYLENLSRNAFLGGEKSPRQTASFGASYVAAENLRFEASAIIYLGFTGAASFGGEYNFKDIFSFSAIYGTNPQSFQTSLILTELNPFNVSFTFYYHNLLGISPQFGLSFLF